MSNVTLLSPIADALNCKLMFVPESRVFSCVSGCVEVEFLTGVVGLQFTFDAVSAVISDSEGASAVLFLGPGELGLAVAYSSSSDGLVAYVLNTALLVVREGVWERKRVESVPKALKKIRGAAVAAYTKDREAKEWAPVQLKGV